MKRHLTKEEILFRMRQKKVATESAKHTTPMVISTMALYTLSKIEKFSSNELVKFQSYMIEHINDDIEEANVLIERKASWRIELENDESMRMKKTGNKFWDDLNQNINDLDYSIYAYAQMYITIMMKYLIVNKGYGKKRLTRVKDELNKMLSEENYCNISDMRQYLLSHDGIVTTCEIAGEDTNNEEVHKI